MISEIDVKDFSTKEDREKFIEKLLIHKPTNRPQLWFTRKEVLELIKQVEKFHSVGAKQVAALFKP